MANVFSGIKIPDSKIAREAAELVRQHETELLFNHSVRVFVFGAMKGVRQNLKFDLSCSMSQRCFTTWGLSTPIIPTRSGLKSMAPTRRANFSEAMALPTRKRIWFGKPSPCIPRPASPNSCGPRSRLQTRVSWWTSLGLDMMSTRQSNATRSSLPFPAVISKVILSRFRPARP